jgi:predicted DNA-binding protein
MDDTFFQQLIPQRSEAEREEALREDERRRRQFRMDFEAEQALDEISQATGLTKATITRRFIREGLARYYRAPAEEAQELKVR